MIDIVLASNNKGKMKEYEELFEGYPISLHLLNELNIASDPKEDGKTYIENALIKAEAIKDKTSFYILADDSGVEFEALGDHFPGINTHRYALENGGNERRKIHTDSGRNLADGIRTVPCGITDFFRAG